MNDTYVVYGSGAVFNILYSVHCTLINGSFKSGKPLVKNCDLCYKNGT